MPIDTSTTQPRWGEAPWEIEAERVEVPLPRRCDVAVIGAGFTGLSTAYHLARRGASVVVLEAGELGAGASGRTGGIVLEGTAAGPMDGVEHCLDALASVVGDAGIDCDLQLPGCWDVRHVGKATGALRWRDGDAWIVIDGVEAGGTVHPGKLVAGLATAARAAGALIHSHTPARAIGADGAMQRVRVGTGELSADAVVVALNAYATRLIERPLPVRNALTLALCTAPLDASTRAEIGLGDGLPFYTVDFPYLWGRVDRAGRIVFGAGLIFPPDGDVHRVDLAQPEGAESMARLEARVRGLHPALADVTVTHRWGGPIAFRMGGVPIFSRLPDHPNVIAYAGCSGHGIALGVRIGQVVANAIVDGTTLPDWGKLAE